MHMLAAFVRSARFALVFVAATLLPLPAGAQAVLSVSPTSVTVQASAGTNAPSQPVQISNAGKGALKWSVVQPSASWVSVSPTRGTNAGTLTLTFATSALAVGVYQTFFDVESTTGSSVRVTVQASVVASAPPLTVTCPGNISVASSDGSPVVVTYSVSTSGGVAPVTVTGNPASGSSFPVRTTSVQVTAQSSDGQTASCTFSVTVTEPTPPPGEWTFCAFENEFCAFSGTKQVRYGANGSYFYKTLSEGTACTNSVFGDPIYGTAKQCHVGASSIALPTLTVTCPADISAISAGSFVPVSYSASATGGVAPVTLTYDPASGGSFPLGTTFVSVIAQSSDGQTATCGFLVTVTYSAPPPPLSAAVGPRAAIACPAGAIDIYPGTSIQETVNRYAGNTTFCLKAGTHPLSSPITPKTGNTFVGEYGAILDGTGWTTTDDTEAAFRAHNQDIDSVTIRNLVIRNLRRGIHAFHTMSSHWTIENNEIVANLFGVVFPSHSMVRNNYIHHNHIGGYLGSYSHSSTFESNEIAYNGWEQKVGESDNVTFRSNVIHHNAGDGIWYDSNNTGALIEGNQVHDNGQMGIFYETSGSAIIRNNTIARNRDTAVFISTSKNAQIYNNLLDGNFRGITYFVNCSSVGGGTTIDVDLANNSAHENTIIVGSESGALASAFSYTLCESAQLAQYQNASKNLTFSHNTYNVPLPATGRYWLWNGLKTWIEWQTIGQDVGSVVH
jgi:parallel beta-helix repeat protein